MSIHKLHSQPSYIMVGTKSGGDSAKFYGARKIWMSSALKIPKSMEKLSLVVPAFYPSKPPMKPRIVKGKKLLNDDGEEVLVQDVDAFDHYVRYFGLVDLDMDMNSIACGAMPLFAGEEAKEYPDGRVVAVKERWVEFIKSSFNPTIQTLREASPAFDQVCVLLLQLWEALLKQTPSIVPHVFFSGMRGFRVLWTDPDLFFWVNGKERFDQAFLRQVAPKYFYERLGLDKGFLNHLDHSVYESKKGVKPDVELHPVSGLAPAYIATPQLLDSTKLTAKMTPKLTEILETYWGTLYTHIPLELAVLKVSASTSLVEEEDEEVKDSKKRKKAFKGFGKKQLKGEKLDDAIEKVDAIDLQTVTLEEGPPKFFTDKILEHLRGPGGQREVERLQYSLIKRFGTDERWMVEFNNCNYCSIAKREHSTPAKIFYLIFGPEGMIYQKCHSSKCQSTLQSRKKKAELVFDSNKLDVHGKHLLKLLAFERSLKSYPSTSSSAVESDDLMMDGGSVTRDGPLGRALEKQGEPRMDPSVCHRKRHFECHYDCREFYQRDFVKIDRAVRPVILRLPETKHLDSQFVSVPLSIWNDLVDPPRRFYFIVGWRDDLQTAEEYGYVAHKQIGEWTSDGNIKIDRTKLVIGPTFGVVHAIYSSIPVILPPLSLAKCDEYDPLPEWEQKLPDDTTLHDAHAKNIDESNPEHHRARSKRIIGNILRWPRVVLSDATLQAHWGGRFGKLMEMYDRHNQQVAV